MYGVPGSSTASCQYSGSKVGFCSWGSQRGLPCYSGGTHSLPCGCSARKCRGIQVLMVHPGVLKGYSAISVLNGNHIQCRGSSGGPHQVLNGYSLAPMRELVSLQGVLLYSELHNGSKVGTQGVHGYRLGVHKKVPKGYGFTPALLVHQGYSRDIRLYPC